MLAASDVRRIRVIVFIFAGMAAPGRTAGGVHEA